MNEYTVTLLKGDGIGPEIVNSAVKVLEFTAKKYGFKINFNEALIGGAAIDALGTPLPEKTVELCKASDAVLLGAVGGPKWDGTTGNMRPEAGLLGIRKQLGLYANIRPARIFAPLRAASPLKDEIIGDGLDIVIVRELTGGIYFGERGRGTEQNEPYAYDTELYRQHEVERIAVKAFELAAQRSGRLCSVDKANVLESSRFWRSIVCETAKKYPTVTLEHLYVDNCAMQLVSNPKRFDVIVTSNLFGDILSDEGAIISGSIGMLASSSLGEGTFGLYEPVHGSAPDIAGTGKANPLATILSAAMMLKTSFNLPAPSEAIEKAVEKTLESCRTAEIYAEGTTLVDCEQMTEAVINNI